MSSSFLRSSFSCAISLAFVCLNPLAHAEGVCIPGTPLCAKPTGSGVSIGGPKVSVGTETSTSTTGTVSGQGSGSVGTPTVTGTVGGGTTSVAAPAIDLSFWLRAAAQASTNLGVAFGGAVAGGADLGAQVLRPEPPQPWMPIAKREVEPPTYVPEGGFDVCGGSHVSTSFGGPLGCLGLRLFPTRWLSVDNEIFYAYGTSVDDTDAHVDLTRHDVFYQPSVAFHAQADIARFSARVGGTLEISNVNRDASSCGLGGPNTAALTSPCTTVGAVDEARAYAGAMAGISFGLAQQAVIMIDVRFVAKARIDGGDRDEPLGRAELGGLAFVRMGFELGHWRP